MDLNFMILVRVMFYSGKRTHPPMVNTATYSPHIVVKHDTEYLGVTFLDSNDPVAFDQLLQATVSPIYEGVGYEKLTKDTAFFIMEGGKLVGDGFVEEIVPHNPKTAY